MAQKIRELYEFGDYQLDVGEQLLLRNGEVVPLKAKVFDTLVLLVENAGRLLEKEWLMRELWPQSFVEEVNLNVNISTLRKVLGESATKPQYIETVPKRGYRFVAQVTKKIIDETPTEVLNDASAEAKNSLAIAAEEINEPSKYVTSPLLELDSLTGKAPDLNSEKEIKPAEKGSLLPTISRWQLTIGATLLLGVIIAGVYFAVSSNSKTKIANSLRVQTIAVLPFKATSTDEANQALGLGMADALINRLGKFKEINVRPTSTVMKYSERETDPIAAGRELGVDVVLAGLVQRSDKNVRISAQLFRVSDGTLLWGDKFDDFFTNVFALQDSISERMAKVLSLQLTIDEKRLLTKRYTENTEAFQLYTQGQYFHFKYQFPKALEYYEQAIKKDPDYALAYAGLAANYIAQAVISPNRQELRDKAVAAIDKALSLDANLGQAYNALGWGKYLLDWDWAGAEQALQRAIELNPNDSESHSNYSVLLSTLDRRDEAISESELALQLDPTSSDTHFQHLLVLYYARRFDQAIEHSKKAIATDPNHPYWGGIMMRIYLAKSLYQEALAEGKKWYSSERLKAEPLVGYAQARLNNRTEAEKILQNVLGKPEGIVKNYTMATIYCGMHEKDQAFAWLEKSYASKDNGIIKIKVDPLWDELRSDPRFDDLLGRLNLRE
ncbi:MAG: winged helix-turn-helix domain-containing protein [Acidobacteriota bacterium]